MKSKHETISDMILDYLEKNPDASDTLDGITWWLAAEVMDVLEILLNEGLIAPIPQSNGRFRFQRTNKQLQSDNDENQKGSKQTNLE